MNQPDIATDAALLDGSAGDSARPGALIRFTRGRLGDFWILGVLGVLVLAFGVLGPGFISTNGWIATSSYAVTYLLLGAGQTFVVISGGIDLSDGAVLGVLALGTAAGLLNGLLVTKARLTPFIATLATLSVFTGAQSLISNGTDITNIPIWMGNLGARNLGGWLPALVLIAFVLVAAAGWFLSRSRFGLRTYAIGSNREAAERAGIRVNRHLLRVYMLSGVLSAVAGWCYLAQFTDASPTVGTGNELGAIAAVVIGGASLMGGRGSMIGSVVGAFIISVLVTGLITMNVPTFWQEVAVGGILAGAVYADQIRGRLANR
jgi:ribose transport system permease protein